MLLKNRVADVAQPRQHGKELIFHACQYGVCYKKPTTVLSFGDKVALVHLDPAFRKCRGRLCSVTGRKHELLSGLQGHKKGWRTAQGSAYPSAFCHAFAKCLAQALL